MLHNFFQAKIRYRKICENGMERMVTEPYIVDALSFTEAESRIIEEISPYINGEFSVSDINRANFNEIFTSDETDAEYWFKCKIYFITLDEKSGAEKKTSANILVQAADLRDAVKKLGEKMKDTMADYSIASVAITGIVDVFPFKLESDEKAEFPSKREDRNMERDVNDFIAQCPDGEIKTVCIGGKTIEIDKTMATKTVVRPGTE